MKYSAIRKNEKKRRKRLKQLITMLSELNPSATFDECSEREIHTNLKSDELGSIKIPAETYFVGDETESCYYGYVVICYDSENYVIKNECIF